MFKNIYIEEVSGNFDGFDYNLNADIENNGAVEVSAFINHSHISFNDSFCQCTGLGRRGA